MYIFSLDNNNRKIVPCNLRSNEKYIFETDSKIGTKYQNSPYYKGTVFWNDLPNNLQFADTVGVLNNYFDLDTRFMRIYVIFGHIHM